MNKYINHKNVLVVITAIFPVIILWKAMFILPIQMLIVLAIFPIMYAVRSYASKDLVNFVQSEFYIKFLLLLLFWGIVSCLWSINYISSVNAIFGLASMLGLCMIIIHYNNKNYDTALLNSLGYIFVCSLYIALLLMNFEIINGWKLSSLFYHYFYHGNFSYKIGNFNRGICMLIIITWPAILFLYKKKLIKKAITLWFMVLLSSLIVVSHSGSITALVGFILASGLFIIVYVFPKKWFRLVVPIVILSTILIPVVFSQHKASVQDYNFLPESSKHRICTWRYYMNKASDRIFTGNGVRSSITFGSNEEECTQWRGVPEFPHNVSIEIINDLGLCGFIIYLAFLISLLYYISRNSLHENNPFYIAFMGGCLVLFLFDFSIFLHVRNIAPILIAINYLSLFGKLKINKVIIPKV